MCQAFLSSVLKNAFACPQSRTKTLSSLQNSPTYDIRRRIPYEPTAMSFDEARGILSTGLQPCTKRLRASISSLIDLRIPTTCQAVLDPTSPRNRRHEANNKDAADKFRRHVGPMVNIKSPEPPHEPASPFVLMYAAGRHVVVGHSVRSAGPTWS